MLFRGDCDVAVARWRQPEVKGGAEMGERHLGWLEPLGLNIVLTPNGAQTTKGTSRLPRDGQWNAALFQQVAGFPRSWTDGANDDKGMPILSKPLTLSAPTFPEAESSGQTSGAERAVVVPDVVGLKLQSNTEPVVWQLLQALYGRRAAGSNFRDIGETLICSIPEVKCLRGTLEPCAYRSTTKELVIMHK